MKNLLSIGMMLLSCFIMAQTVIEGTLKDDNGHPIPFANVYLEDIYDGGATDADGFFSFVTEYHGDAILSFSAVGYMTKSMPLTVKDKTISVLPILSSDQQRLNEVVISAGSLEASDEKKGAVLKPIDIVTNAGAAGDIIGALNTLPGVSKVGDQTGIFVRGGDASEVKTIIDGTVVDNPFFGEVPNVASRSRFDPFMFKGTTFTTGGYSAEYGQALSSVLILNTQGIPEISSTGIGVNMSGISLTHSAKLSDNTALIGGLGYSNLQPLFSAVRQNVTWEKAPEGMNASLAYRHKTDKGIFKSYLQYQHGTIGIIQQGFDGQEGERFRRDNDNLYLNTSYQGALKDKWGIYAGLASNMTNNDMSVGELALGSKDISTQGKLTVYHDPSNMISMKLGVESFISDDQRSLGSAEQIRRDVLTASFFEADIKVGANLALRLGSRVENDMLISQTNLAPRASLAYKTGDKSQVSLAYGHFYQKPDEVFLYESTSLDFEQSRHYISNYQWSSEERTFRIEAYYKDYQDLIKYQGDILTNEGNGYSRGIDFFWRDKKTVKHLDYWISYSYVDAIRDYRRNTGAVIPSFVTNHTVSAILNYKIRSQYQIGLAYAFASGRTFQNPNGIDVDKTINYHNLDLNTSYVTSLFKRFTVVYFALSNMLNIDQEFGFRYNEDGTFRQRILPTTGRSFFLGIFISI